MDVMGTPDLVDGAHRNASVIVAVSVVIGLVAAYLVGTTWFEGFVGSFLLVGALMGMMVGAFIEYVLR